MFDTPEKRLFWGFVLSLAVFVAFGLYTSYRDSRERKREQNAQRGRSTVTDDGIEMFAAGTMLGGSYASFDSDGDGD